MDRDITIVTAFFDINRSSMKGFNRSNDKYIEYFKFWAKIKNNIVVFSDKDTIKKVLEIRKEYGLLDKTKTFIVDDYLKLDSELYESIDKCMNNNNLLDFHLQRNIPEAISSKYNYIMALKAWCVCKAVDLKLASGMIAWLDFGFNYGGKYYKNADEFDFEWKYKFSNKIHLLQINDLDNLPPYEIIRRNNSYIQGGEIIAPDYLWKELWELVRDNMISLNKSGLADDDQILYLMAYRRKPEIFEMHRCGWLELFTTFSNKSFTFEIPQRNKLFDFLYKCKHPTEFIFIRQLNYSFRTFKDLRKTKFKG